MAMISNQKVLNPQKRRTFTFLDTLGEKMCIRLSTPAIYPVQNSVADAYTLLSVLVFSFVFIVIEKSC